MGKFSRFFIERPIFASVIAIIIALAGVIASQILPVAQGRSGPNERQGR